MRVDEHRKAGPSAVGTAVLTVSDTRTVETDRSGRIIQELLRAAGHRVVHYRIVRDEPEQIRRLLLGWIGIIGEVEAILISGGTGLAPRDGTFEVVDGLLEKRLDGFGELFRALSFDAVGPAAMLSRAVAGLCRGTLLMSMPGSEAAVRLAMTRLILPELSHMVSLAAGGRGAR